MSISKDNQTLLRKEAARFLGKTPGSLAVMDFRNKNLLKPEKDEHGKVFYYLAHLEEYQRRRLKP